MGIFDVFRKSSPEVKESAAGHVAVVNPGQPAWTPRQYDKLADEGYTRNVVAYKAVNAIADAVASVPWLAFSGKNELSAHPILDLINRPNPQQSRGDYMRAKVSFFLLSGNGYEEPFTLDGRVRELYQLRPDRTTITPGANGIPVKYTYKVGGRQQEYGVEPGPAPWLRHIKTFNPLNDWYGLSPIEAGAYAIDQHNEASAWIKSLLQNSARPSGAIKYNDGAGGSLTEEQFNRLKAGLEDAHQGARNAGRPMLLEGSLDWVPMGLSPVDMAILETKYSAARDVCLAFGVPPQLLGIPGDNTYSNYQEARLAFWEDTVIPLISMFSGDWNSWLAGPEDIELKPDYDQIPAIVDKRAVLWKSLQDADFLSVNEKREAAGYGAVNGGNDVLVQSSMIGLEMATDPADAAPSDLTAADVKAWVYGSQAD